MQHMFASVYYIQRTTTDDRNNDIPESIYYRFTRYSRFTRTIELKGSGDF